MSEKYKPVGKQIALSVAIGLVTMVFLSILGGILITGGIVPEAYNTVGIIVGLLSFYIAGVFCMHQIKSQKLQFSMLAIAILGGVMALIHALFMTGAPFRFAGILCSAVGAILLCALTGGMKTRKRRY